MPAIDDELTAARQRIAAAYDPELVRTAGHRLADLLATHFARVQGGDGSVLNWNEPRANADAAAAMLGKDATDRPPAEVFGELIQACLSRGLNLHNPRYIGHQVPAPVPIAGLFDAVGSATNQCMAIYEMGPWATGVERALIEELGQLIGWKKGNFAGAVTHGGSLANLTALLTARNVALGESWKRGVGTSGRAPVIVSHAEAHYCIARSAGILGLGTNQVVKAALDGRRKIDPNKLDDTLRDLRARNVPIVAVAACACATPVGAFDPLAEIADVCRRHEVWMHVDAAHGGATLFSNRHRHLLAGVDRVDSVIWDAHKMLFVPALCAFVFYKDPKYRFEAFQQDAPYLFDPSEPGLADFDSGLKTIECTKRAQGLGLWGVWTLFGKQLFADMVDVTFDMGRRFYEKLVAAPDFEPLNDPECNIVVFRHIPDSLRDAPKDRVGTFQLELRREVIRSGEYYIVPTAKDGVAALRTTIINPLTTPDHLDGLMDSLREHGRRLLA